MNQPKSYDPDGIPRILPLLWLHGESFDVLSDEIEKMHSAGLEGFIAESRPFPEYLEESWFKTLDFVLDKAESLNMKVLLFDDQHFPTGNAGGRLSPENRKLLVRRTGFDMISSGNTVSFDFRGYRGKDENIVAASAFPVSPDNRILASEGIDLGRKEKTGALRLTPGVWRISVFLSTRDGGEEHTKNHVNYLSSKAVSEYVGIVYESHYDRLKRHVGKSFIGFFSDEPRLANAASYDAVPGIYPMPLPWSDELAERLGSSPGLLLTHICFNSDQPETTAQMRFRFMDAVSRLYSENFPQRLGAWCKERKLLYIGHVVEDNGAHARLGYGNGHFFRSMKGQSFPGVDSVLGQHLPGFTSGKHDTPFGLHDSDFFHWGLAKMASSCAHLDPAAWGTAFAEVFGAYGWEEGLSQMKVHTDHMLVRGINLLIPHAFSPKSFPDPDCPPHFYARGHNPQWRYFGHWTRYASRLCGLFSGGTHIAQAAVLYHAEAEWSGFPCMPFERIIKTLAEHQVDCDVISADMLCDLNTEIENGNLHIAGEFFRILLIGASSFLPEKVLARLLELAEKGLCILFVDSFPENLRNHSGLTRIEKEHLPRYFKEHGIQDFVISEFTPFLRSFHYQKDCDELYLLVNENNEFPVDVCAYIPSKGPFLLYDVMTETRCLFEGRLKLAPGESAVLMTARDGKRLSLPFPDDVHEIAVWTQKDFRIFLASAEEYPAFSEVSSIPADFAGTVSFRLDFEVHCKFLKNRRYWILIGTAPDITECFLNGNSLGCRYSPPLRFETSGFLHPGKNHLQIDRTGTLVRRFGNTIFDAGYPRTLFGLPDPIRLVCESHGNRKK